MSDPKHHSEAAVGLFEDLPGVEQRQADEAQQALADAEARRLELAELLCRGGVASQFDRLDAERNTLAARQAVVQLQLARRCRTRCRSTACRAAACRRRPPCAERAVAAGAECVAANAVAPR